MAQSKQNKNFQNNPVHPSGAPLAGVADIICGAPIFQGVRAHKLVRRLDLSGPASARAWLAATMVRDTPLLVVAPTSRDAEELHSELEDIVGDRVAVLPAWETLPHERLSPSADTIGRRHEIFYRQDELDIIITAARGYCQPVAEPTLSYRPLEFSVGEDAEFSALAEQLVYFGYKHVDMVAARGEFAVRGGLIDIFPATTPNPVRLEFWGDEVTSLRWFSVNDQRTIDDVAAGSIQVYPTRAFLLDDALRASAQDLITAYPGNAQLVEMATLLAEGSYRDGMESLASTFFDGKLLPLPKVLGEKRRTLIIDPERVRARIADLARTDEEFALAAFIIPTSVGEMSYISFDGLAVAAEAAGGMWTFSPPGMSFGALDDTLAIDLGSIDAPRGDAAAIAAMNKTIKASLAAGAAVVYVAAQAGVVKRAKQKFLDAGIPAYIAEPASAPGKEPGVAIYQARSHAGFQVNRGQTELILITDTDVTGNRVGEIAPRKRAQAKRRPKVDPLALVPGDLVVHETHGIGKFIRMTERVIDTGEESSRREFLVLEYAPSKKGMPGDQLYVPMDALDMLSKYVGGEKPTLSKMGGSDWKNTKKKARSAVREIAGELVELYAKRQAAPGHPFAPDNPWQREMEDNFPYTETADQLMAIEAVKYDMEQPTPMDRVVVGDVGYGKTEVAVRAAFKAVQDGKQVAVLVPTTLLAQQHQSTFETRMAGFPVTIRGLSRFTTKSEAKEILAGLADGSVDIVIGTHRLLQTGVHWKNLGLVIVDEEQRFGVEHKEHIKAMRTHVDVLTMSATPIPRTLEMSMAGIREMSTILTPPEDRHPILTYVGAQDENQIAAAIRRELLRDGQVFYVHNKVKSIEKRARELRDLVPEARIVVAHGQMSEEQLERTVQGFWNREYDVLVCTTIVETGLDIANANTLIVENAHQMGLSQLHQLRGRVGRSRERGYAYFLYPKDQELSETSYDRLVTIAENSDLGAGMAVAMKDLEMRGAGNVLGAEQSGHIAGVGFDLYIRLVGEAVEAFKAIARGEVVDATDHSPREIRIDLPVDAHIPESYIPSERLRLEVYRKFAEAKREADLTSTVEEMQDRYGPLPDEVERMLSLARLRFVCRLAGITDIGTQGQRIKLHPVELPDSKQVRLKRLYSGATYRPAVKTILLPIPKTEPRVNAPHLRDVELVQWVADFISNFFEVEKVDVSGKQMTTDEQKQSRRKGNDGDSSPTVFSYSG